MGSGGVIVLFFVVSAVLTILINNSIKVILYFFERKKLYFELLYHSFGGMPSGHAALLASLCMGVYLISGLSVEFSIALIISTLMISDLNTWKWFHSSESKFLKYLVKRKSSTMKEGKRFIDMAGSVGHTVPEIIVGISLGVVVSCLTHQVFLKFFLV